MHHPQSRGERRAVRGQVIARRRFIATRIWHDGFRFSDTQWGRYSKFNLNCGCKMCHSAKYLSAKRKRRRALQTADSGSQFRKGDRTIKY